MITVGGALTAPVAAGLVRTVITCLGCCGEARGGGDQSTFTPAAGARQSSLSMAGESGCGTERLCLVTAGTTSLLMVT